MFRKLTAVLAVSAALTSPSVWSLGLGEIKNDSNLNQPLQAQIKLLSSKDFSEQDLRARIASFEAYSKFGITKEALHNQISFKTVTLADGSKAIEVTTNSTIREPYLNFLVELSWPQGRLLREYTLLLDPPIFNKTLEAVATSSDNNKLIVPKVGRTTTDPRQKEDAQEVTLPQEESLSNDTQAQVEETSPEPQPEVQAKTQTEQSSAAVRRVAPSFEGNNWHVKRGDTLWAIASRVKPEGVSVQQTLISLYRNNPSAFINNDIDRLKAGVGLSIPSSSRIESVSKNMSVADLRSELTNDSAPLDVRKTVEESDTTNTVSRGGRLTIASVDKNSLESNGSSSDAEEAENLQNEIDNLREAVETLKLQNEQLQAELVSKEPVNDAGLAIADDTLSVIAGSAEAAEEGLDAIAVAEESSQPVEKVSTTEQVTNSEPQNSSVATAEETTANLDAQTEKSPLATKSNVNTTSNEKSFWQKNNFLIWLSAGITGLLALIGAAFFIRKVRNDSEEELEAGFTPRELNQDEPRQSFLEQDDMSIPEEESDPVIESEILIARGKLTKAQQLLENALNTDPSNDTIRVKLLEIYASQQKIEEFNQLKQTLPEGFDHDSELGLKVASLIGLLGAEAEDGEPEELFGGSNFELPSEDDVFGDDSAQLDNSEKKNINEIDLSESLEPEESNLEFDSITDNAETDKQPENELEENVGKQEKHNEDGSIEFSSSLADFDSSVAESLDSTVEELEATETGNDNSIEFSLSESETSEQDSLGEEDNDSHAVLSDDEAETKLELARAYIEMGDDEAAKDILEEVTKEGSGKQSSEAEALLSKI